MRAYCERIVENYPTIQFAEWIKKHNQYYLPQENLFDGDWYITTLPLDLQKLILLINERDWSYGIEYNELIQQLESELKFYLYSGNYSIEHNEKNYLNEFLDFCYANGWEKEFGEDEENDDVFDSFIN